MLITEGDATDWMMLLLKGTVDVGKRLGHDAAREERGDNTRLAVLRSGAVLGEMSMFDGEPRYASCWALREGGSRGAGPRGRGPLIKTQPGDRRQAAGQADAVAGAAAAQYQHAAGEGAAAAGRVSGAVKTTEETACSMPWFWKSTLNSAPPCARSTTISCPKATSPSRSTYSTLNYKDGLAITNKVPVVRSWPMVAGIDGAGTVRREPSPAWKAGDRSC